MLLQPVKGMPFHDFNHYWHTMMPDVPAGGSNCPLTGTQLEFPLTLRPQLKLRAAIEVWAAENGVELASPVYGRPLSRSISGTFVTKQGRLQQVVRLLKGFGSFLVSKRPFDCQLH